METTVNLILNKEPKTVATEGARLLLDVLREDFGMTGTKYGCGEGQCGACTVLVDGKEERSCQLSIREVADKQVTTIEGLSPKGELHPVQAAFLAEGAAQCGYCTPGMILSIVALLKSRPAPSDTDIADWMNGHLCRCCGYLKIVKAVRRAANASFH